MQAASLKKSLIIGLALLMACGSVKAKKMYRWVDEAGNVYFSDQVPPDQAQFKRETLNEKAKVLDVLEKAKTPAQIAQQKKLDALRVEQDKIIAKQISNDKVLLANFRTLADIQRAYDNKRTALDLDQKLLEGNIKRLEQQLLKFQQQAADLERNAQKVPDKLVTDMAAAKQGLEAAKIELNHRIADRQKTEKELQADLDRYQFLTQSAEERKKLSSLPTDESKEVNSLGVFTCQNASQCEQAWKIAGEFVAEFSSTAKNIESDKLIMRAMPQSDDEFSLSVAKLESDGQQQIFLDVHCTQTSLGDDLCRSNKIKNLRQSFVPYVQSQLASQH
jgi:hypothetical protein